MNNLPLCARSKCRRSRLHLCVFALIFSSFLLARAHLDLSLLLNVQQSANAMFAAGKFLDAVEEYTRAIELAPTNAILCAGGFFFSLLFVFCFFFLSCYLFVWFLRDSSLALCGLVFCFFSPLPSLVQF